MSELCKECKHLDQRGNCMHPSNISLGSGAHLHGVDILRMPGRFEAWIQGFGYMCGKRGKNWEAKVDS